jgi:hypothetical protein
MTRERMIGFVWQKKSRRVEEVVRNLGESPRLYSRAQEGLDREKHCLLLRLFRLPSRTWSIEQNDIHKSPARHVPDRYPPALVPPSSLSISQSGGGELAERRTRNLWEVIKAASGCESLAQPTLDHPSQLARLGD